MTQARPHAQNPHMTMAQKNRALTKMAADYDGSTPLPEVRHELFVSGIVQGMTNSKAYTSAGFKAKPPHCLAWRLQQRPHIIARLAYRRAQLAQTLAVTEERVLAEIAKIAFDNTIVYVTRVNKRGTKISTQQPSVAARDKLVALEQLGKHLGLFEKDNEQKRDSLAIFLAGLG